MTSNTFIEAVQSRAARIAVGASAVRGRGNRGVVQASRRFLRQLDLAPFGTDDPKRFAAALDRATNRLRRSLPRRARHWGVARKVVNLFLQHCL